MAPFVSIGGVFAVFGGFKYVSPAHIKFFADDFQYQINRLVWIFHAVKNLKNISQKVPESLSRSRFGINACADGRVSWLSLLIVLLIVIYDIFIFSVWS